MTCVAERANWQMCELVTFLIAVFGQARIGFSYSPVKVASGAYTPIMGVERPQHDLVTDMVLELSRLPRFTAYTKITQQEKGSQIAKMQTHKLPDIATPNGEVVAMQNAHKLSKKRDDIEAEIRERQNRWGRGGSAPRTKAAR
jgi:hypothetical protein